MTEQMNSVLDLWCGTKSATEAFEDQGWSCVSVDREGRYQPSICADIMEVEPWHLLAANHGEKYTFGWASPECTVYSIANMKARHFVDRKPSTVQALLMDARVQWTIHLLEETCETWVMENPRGMLRSRPFMQDLPRVTVAYCQYGDVRQKPTDLWGRFPRLWEPKPMCKPNSSCHEAAPRGSKGGTQGLSREDRIQVPYELGRSFRNAIQDDDWKSIPKPTLKEWL